MSQNFDDIWFTYKARIAAEFRLKTNDIQSQILLVWYAIASSVMAVVGLRNSEFLGPNTDLYSAILSIVLLAISMLIAVRDYKGRAIAMRTNHIELKLLHDELEAGVVALTDKPKLYSKLLLGCENHSSYDYRYFRIFAATSKPATVMDFIAVFIHFSMRWTFISVLYAFPVFLICWNFFKTASQ